MNNHLLMLCLSSRIVNLAVAVIMVLGGVAQFFQLGLYVPFFLSFLLCESYSHEMPVPFRSTRVCAGLWWLEPDGG